MTKISVSSYLVSRETVHQLGQVHSGQKRNGIPHLHRFFKGYQAQAPRHRGLPKAGDSP